MGDEMRTRCMAVANDLLLLYITEEPFGTNTPPNKHGRSNDVLLLSRAAGRAI
jgi:hypothetical protein